MTLQGADRVIALTPGEASRLARWGVDPERIRVIPNGLDLEEFAGVLARPNGAPQGEPVILYVGRIYPEQKGLDTLLEAFGIVARGNRSQLRLVGEDWGGLDAVRRLARRAGVEDRVHATGTVSRADLLAEYAGANLLVLPSHFDSFPFVLLEAMASGLPVVATRVGGIPEVAIHGTTAVLVPPGDPPALAEAIGRVLADPALGARLGAAGRQRAESYSWDRVIPQYLSLLAEVIDGV
jgi:D-inositol-3-phosphate glycosyltransferase